MLHYSQAPQLTMLPPSLSIFHQGHQHLQRDQSAVGFLLELLELLWVLASLEELYKHFYSVLIIFQIFLIFLL